MGGEGWGRGEGAFARAITVCYSSFCNVKKMAKIEKAITMAIANETNTFPVFCSPSVTNFPSPCAKNTKYRTF